MAIRHRRGEYKNLDKTKLKEAEIAVVTTGDPNTKDGKSAYVSFGGGSVKRFVTEEELGEVKDVVEVVNEKADSALNTMDNIIDDVNDSRDQALQDIADAEKTSSQAVSAEGQKQLEAVEKAVEEIIEDRKQIEQNRQQLEKHEGQIQKNTRDIRNLLITEESEGSIIVDDSTAEYDFCGMRIYGKSAQPTTTGAQLLNLLDGKSGTGGGVTYSRRNDGSYERKGTANNVDGNMWLLGEFEVKEVLFTLDAGSYSVKDCALFGYSNQVDGGTYTSYQDSSFTLSEPFLVTGVRNPSHLISKNYDDIIYPMLNKGETQILFEPYTGGKPSPSIDYPQEIESAGESGSIESTVCGGNICPVENGNTNFYINTKVQAGTTYTICAKQDAEVNFNIQIRNIDGKEFISIEDKKLKDGCCIFMPEKSGEIYINSFKTVNWTGISVYIGEVTTYRYEPYKQQSLTIQTPNGLPGIPVTSGGNYTDANGQQWIADEIDFERGVYVQRCNTRLLDGTETWVLERGDWVTNDNLFYTNVNDASKKIGENSFVSCYEKTIKHYNNLKNGESTWYQDVNNRYPNEHFIYFKNDSANNSVKEFKELLKQNPITLTYILAKPIEKPLSEEEIEAYIALHSNYPTTTITNDADAHMQVTIAQDTKKYIEKQIDKVLKQVAETQIQLLEGSI